MIALGTIQINPDTGFIEARKKLLLIGEQLTGDPIVATRLATAASQFCRVLARESSAPAISLGLGSDRFSQSLVLEFESPEPMSVPATLSGFFDDIETPPPQNNMHVVKVTKNLRGHTNRSDQDIARLRSIVERKGRDELVSELQVRNRELQESFENLQRTTSAKERMQSELNIGRDIQMSMLPVQFPAFPNRKEFDVYATLHPAREVGGDFYDFFLIDEDRFCFCVGDVSGKGVGAALFMALTKTLIKSRASNDFSPASILTHVNDEVGRNNDSCMFVTIWVGILDLKTGILAYTNAGHNPPYIKRANGELVRLDARHGPVVGAMDGMVYGEDDVTVGKGDMALLYTDGVTEAMDPNQHLYDESRLVQVMEARDFSSGQDLVQATVDDVWRFQSDAEQADDITVLAVQFFGQPEAAPVHLLEVKIPNHLDEIDTVNAAFNAFAEEKGLKKRVRRKINLVFDELLNNIVTYAHDDDRDHTIEVKVELSADRLAVTVIDDGKPFNPFLLAAPDTGQSVEEREVGGLGVHLVRNVMDEMSYHRRTDRNVVILIKHLEPSART